MKAFVYASVLSLIWSVPAEAAKVKFQCRFGTANNQNIDVAGSYILSKGSYRADSDVIISAPKLEYKFYTRIIEMTSNGSNWRLDAEEFDDNDKSNTISLRHSEGSAAQDADVQINISASAKTRAFKFKSSSGQCRFLRV